MSPPDPAHLRKLAEAIAKDTPGPWVARVSDRNPHDWFVLDNDGTAVVEEAWARDAEYLAALDPATVLAILDQLATLTRERDEARAWRASVIERLESAE